MSQITIRRVLISLADKSGLEELLRGFSRHGLELYSTGGTYVAIRQWLEQNPEYTDTTPRAALRLIKLEDYLNYPEMPGGLVKTLHPRVHGGLLADLEDVKQVAHMQEQGMVAFDLLAVNLYPFEDTVARNASLEECRQQIDIGGVAMLRAAAKNFGRVAVLARPQDYAEVLQEMAPAGQLSSTTLRKLARIAFQQVLAYDRAISQYFDALEEVPC